MSEVRPCPFCNGSKEEIDPDNGYRKVECLYCGKTNQEIRVKDMIRTSPRGKKKYLKFYSPGA